MEHDAAKGDIVVFYFGASNFNHKACTDSTGVLERLSVRFIIIDRPGYGHSTLTEDFNDSPLLFARNTFPHILRHFGCSPSEGIKGSNAVKPYLIGYQMGCIYVLSIAYLYPSAVEEMTMICPPTPFREGPSTQIMSPTDCAMRWCTVNCIWCIFWCHYRPTVRRHFVSAPKYLEFVETQSAASASSEDFKFLRRNKTVITSKWNEQWDEGRVDGMADDRVWTEWFVLLAEEWGFSLDSIRTHCHLWYGTEDVMSPYSEWYQSALSNVTAHRVEGYGHLLIYPKFDDIISSMIHCDL